MDVKSEVYPLFFDHVIVLSFFSAFLMTRNVAVRSCTTLLLVWTLGSRSLESDFFFREVKEKLGKETIVSSTATLRSRTGSKWRWCLD